MFIQLGVSTFALASLISNLLTQGLVIESSREADLAPEEQLVMLQGHMLMQSSNPDTYSVRSCRLVTVTAYSSTPDQTDSTPFITASGTYVRDGVIACNFLEFGTKVRFPQQYGDKVFVVEDRMALKNSHKIDIWFPTRDQAKQFGVQYLQVEVLNM